MLVLIDYDNVEPVWRHRGLINLMPAVLHLLPDAVLTHGTDVVVRLYGGWYEEHKLTKSAQRLTREIATHFPAGITLHHSDGVLTVKVRVELARSLNINPGKDLLHTFRRRGVPAGLVARRHPLRGCADPPHCSLIAVHTLVSNRRCVTTGCTTQLEDVLAKSEQKLVDSMIIADLIFAAASGEEEVVVVSTDDDLLPGIATAVQMGTDLYHVHPRAGRSTHKVYRDILPAAYHELALGVAP